jgi:hypothetical protein
MGVMEICPLCGTNGFVPSAKRNEYLNQKEHILNDKLEMLRKMRNYLQKKDESIYLSNDNNAFLDGLETAYCK